MTIPTCKHCGGSCLVTSTKRKADSFAVQYRTCDTCGAKSTTRKWKGQQIDQEDIFRNLVKAGTDSDIPKGTSVYLVAVDRNGVILERVELDLKY